MTLQLLDDQLSTFEAPEGAACYVPVDALAPIRLSEVIGALSYALDITEGQPMGHAARSCLIAMRLASAIDLPAADRSALFYAALLKDLGCSSNAAKMSYLFGADDRGIKHDLKTVDWCKATENMKFVRSHLAPEASGIGKLLKAAALMLQGPKGAKQLVETRCERGADIARKLGFPEATSLAISHLDEHHDGAGHPKGLRGAEISLLGRICGLAQTVEVFHASYGVEAALQMAAARSGKWFDPILVEALLRLRGDTVFWESLSAPEPHNIVSRHEPEEEVRLATEADLENIAEAFAQVVDAKSPWTFRHSSEVARIASGMAGFADFAPADVRKFRRTALLHDIGKLGVSNMILDKPGKLTDEEFSALKSHPEHSQAILSRLDSWASDAIVAGSHHERLDGRGYYRGLPEDSITRDSRFLTVADVFEALTAARPYRAAMPVEKALSILDKDSGTAFCPQAVAALKAWLARETPVDRVEAQMEKLDALVGELK